MTYTATILPARSTAPSAGSGPNLFSVLGYPDTVVEAVRGAAANGYMATLADKLAALDSYKAMGAAAAALTYWARGDVRAMAGSEVSRLYGLARGTTDFVRGTHGPSITPDAAGRPWLNFNDPTTARQMVSPANTLLGGAPGVTAIVAFEYDGTAGQNSVLLDIYNNNYVLQRLRLSTNGRLEMQGRRASSTGSLQTATATAPLAAGKHVAAMRVDPATGAGTVYLDGAEVASNSAFWATSTAGYVGSASVGLGMSAATADPNLRWPGLIAEAQVYRISLALEQIQAETARMSTRWGMGL